MSDAVLRQWAILRALPRYPRKMAAKEVESRLQRQGFENSKRTIERDLEKLSGLWPISADQRNRPYGWFWSRGAEVLDIPGMDLPTALAFQLAREYLSPLLPPDSLACLEPHFDRAGQVLGEAGATKLRAWPNKVRVIGHGPNLLPPTTAPDVHNKVLQALFESKRIKALYTPRESEDEREYIINPLGAVFRQSVVYLVGSLWDYEDIKQFALHRFSVVELTEEKVKPSKRFDLDEYIQQGAFGYPVSSKTIKLKVLFNKSVVRHLYEAPLSTDQHFEVETDGRVALTASVLDTEDLRWWLLGFGAAVEVKAPIALRRHFGQIARSMETYYQGL